MSENEGRVKNATKVDKYGLHFRSKLECYTYEAFMKAGIPVEYEPKHFTLLNKFEFNKEKIRAITYLPDFIGNYKNIKSIAFEFTTKVKSILIDLCRIFNSS